MSFSPSLAELGQLVHESSPHTILIDGPSGAGKTSLAQYLEQSWPGDGRPQLLHMDDLYPGWDGLAAGAELARELLTQRALGRPVSWQRYDWHAERRTTWHSLHPHRPLILEGCGSLTAATAALASCAIFVDAPAELRQRDALARDGAALREHLLRWEQQYHDWAAREHPQRFATAVVRRNG
jgi:uridine kinase